MSMQIGPFFYLKVYVQVAAEVGTVVQSLYPSPWVRLGQGPTGLRGLLSFLAQPKEKY